MFEDISKVLLITDMDGTFLPSAKIPSKKNLAAVERLMNAGGKFTIATGRSLQASMQYFKSVRVNCPAIMCNGGMIYDIYEKKHIHDVYISEKARELTRLVIENIPTVGCEALPIEGVYVPKMSELERKHCEICKVEPVECSVDDIPENWYKVLFAESEERMDELIAYIDSIKDDDYADIDLVRSTPIYYELLPKNISKGAALKKLREACGFEDHTIVAAGDYNNDLEMLEYADLGFAPSNSSDEVKAAADIVLEKSCDEDAVAEVVDYIFSQVK